MPQMKARARIVVDFPLDVEVPDLEHEPVSDSERTALRATNEDKVLKARANAAREAESVAKTKFPDAVEIVIEEVSEA